MYVCSMCVCVYVGVYDCVGIMCVCGWVYSDMAVCVCIRVCISVCMYVRVNVMRVCIWVCM